MEVDTDDDDVDVVVVDCKTVVVDVHTVAQQAGIADASAVGLMDKFEVDNIVVDVLSAQIQVLGLDGKDFEGSFGEADFGVVACI